MATSSDEQQLMIQVSNFAKTYWEASYPGTYGTTFGSPRRLNLAEMWTEAINPNIMNIIAISLWRVDVFLSGQRPSYVWVVQWADGRFEVEREGNDDA